MGKSKFCWSESQAHALKSDLSRCSRCDVWLEVLGTNFVV
jgi:hypothetical protein